MDNKNLNLFIVHEPFDSYEAALLYLDGKTVLEGSENGKCVHEAGRCVILNYKLKSKNPEELGVMMAVETRSGQGGLDYYYLLTPYVNTVYGVCSHDNEPEWGIDSDIANIHNGETWLWNIKHGKDEHSHCFLVTKDKDDTNHSEKELRNAQLFINSIGELWIVTVEESVVENIDNEGHIEYTNYCYARKLNDILTKDEIVALIQTEIAKLEASLDEKYGYDKNDPFAKQSSVDDLWEGFYELENKLKELDAAIKGIDTDSLKSISTMNSDLEALKIKVSALEQRLNGGSGTGSGGSTVRWTQIQTTGKLIATIEVDGQIKPVYVPEGDGSGEGGGSSESGNSTIPVIIFKGTTSKLDKPSAPQAISGWYDGNSLQVPEEGADGWHISNDFGEDEYVWMSAGAIILSGSSAGNVTGNGWSSPILIAEPRSAIMGDKGFYSLDLSNEIDIIGLGGDLTLDVEVPLNPTTVTLYDGSEIEPIKKENVSIINSEDSELITYVISDNEDGTVDIAFTLHEGLSFKEEETDGIKNKSISIVVTKGDYVRTKYYTLGAVREGKEGVVYRLITSVGAIPFTTTNGSLTPSISEVKCQVFVGNEEVNLGSEYKVFYSIGTNPVSSPILCPGGVFDTGILSNAFEEKMVIFYLYKGDKLLDREGVPFIKDGQDGVDGTPGADADGVEYIYCLNSDPDTAPDFPEVPTGGAETEELRNLFDNVESKESEEYGEAIWFDRAQSISPDLTTAWIASRTKLAISTEGEEPVWIYTGPRVWSHWGKDGTDGDGVEYIFKGTSTRTTPNANPGNYASHANKSYIDAILELNDFYPGDGWFEKDSHKTDLKNYLEDTEGREVSSEEINEMWDILKRNLQELYGTNWGWTDDPAEPDAENNRYIWVAIRRYNGKTGEWEDFGPATLWNVYTENTFTAFAFAVVPSGVDLSGTQPEGGSINHQWPDAQIVGETTITWHDAPKDVIEGSVVWMTKAIISTVVSSALEWSEPWKMSDSSNFNVEWSSNELTASQYSIVREAFNAIDNPFNIGTILKSNSGMTLDQAEAKFRELCRNKSNFDFSVEFDDTADGSIYMATCTQNNGVWSNWSFVKIKGENGAPGTSISIKGPIKYEIIYEEDTYPSSVDDEYIFNNISGTPRIGDKVVILPHSAETDKDGIYRGNSEDGSLLIYVNTDGHWELFNSFHGAQNGDAYTTESGHLIVFDGAQDKWFDTGKLKGETGDVFKNVTKFAVSVTDPSQIANYESWDSAGRDEGTWLEETGGIAKIQINGTDVYIKEYTQSNILDAEYLGNCTYNATLDIVPPIYSPDDWTWTRFHGQDAAGFEVIYAKVNPRKYPDGLVRCPGDLRDQKEGEVWTPNKYGYLPKWGGINWMDDWSNDSLITDPDLIEWIRNNGEVDIYKCWREKESNGEWSEFKGQLLPDLNEDRKFVDKSGNVIELAADSANDDSMQWKVLIPAENSNLTTGSIVNDEDIKFVQYAVGFNAGENKFIGSTNYYIALAAKPKDSEGFHLNNDGGPNKSYWKTKESDTGFGDKLPYLYKIVESSYSYYSSYSSPELIQEWVKDLEYGGTTRWYLKSKSGGESGYYGQSFAESNNGKPFPTSGNDKGIDYWTTDVITFDSTYQFLWAVDETVVNKVSSFTYPQLIAMYKEGTPGKDSISLKLDNPSDEIAVSSNNTIISKEGITLQTTATLWRGTTKVKIASTNDVFVNGEPTGDNIETKKTLNADGSVTIQIILPTGAYLRDSNCVIMINYGGSYIKANYGIKTRKSKASYTLNCSTSSIHVKYDDSVDPKTIKLSVRKIDSTGAKEEAVTGTSKEYKVFYSADGENWTEYVDTDGKADGEVSIDGLFDNVAEGGSLKIVLAVPKEGSSWSDSNSGSTSYGPSPESGKAIYNNGVWYFSGGEWIQKDGVIIKGYYNTENGAITGFDNGSFIIITHESKWESCDILKRLGKNEWETVASSTKIYVAENNLPETWPLK